MNILKFIAGFGLCIIAVIMFFKMNLLWQKIFWIFIFLIGFWGLKEESNQEANKTMEETKMNGGCETSQELPIQPESSMVQPEIKPDETKKKRGRPRKEVKELNNVEEKQNE